MGSDSLAEKRNFTEKFPEIITDDEIINGFVSRDERAVSAVMRKYGKQLFVIANRFLNNKEDSEQCVNDALMKAWEAFPENKPRELLPFLAVIIRNTALSKLRSDGAAKRPVTDVLDELGSLVSDSSTEDNFNAKELEDTINKFLGTLRSEHRRIFLMRCWACCELSEIASRTGMTEGSVAVTLTRIRNKLKVYLKKRGYDI